MTIARWTPVREFVSLRDAMDKLFAESFIPPTLLGMEHKTFPVDLYEKPELFMLKVSIPGFDPQKISIEATTTMVTIKGELKEEEKEEKAGTVIRQELRYGMFERVVELPTEIDPAKVEATYEKGLLVVTLPKSEFVKPKTIKVKVV